MNDYDLTGKFGWYIALGFLVLVPAILKWCEFKGYITCEPDPTFSLKPLLANSMSQVEIELASIRGEIALIAPDLARQQITVNSIADRVERIDQRL